MVLNVAVVKPDIPTSMEGVETEQAGQEIADIVNGQSVNVRMSSDLTENLC